MTEHNHDHANDSAAEELFTGIAVSVNGQIMKLEDAPDEILEYMREKAEENTEGMPPEMRKKVIETIAEAYAKRVVDRAMQQPEVNEQNMITQELAWQLGNILFPDNPHLWQALEILLSLHRVDSEELHLHALHRAHDHIHEAIEAASEPEDESPIESLMKQFRKQMNGE